MERTLYDIAQNLRRIVRSDERKHTPYITVRKELIFPLVDDICSRTATMARNCNQCQLYKDSMDKKVAMETIDRLIAYASSARHAVLTKDEAENLRNIFRTNYTT